MSEEKIRITAEEIANLSPEVAPSPRPYPVAAPYQAAMPAYAAPPPFPSPSGLSTPFKIAMAGGGVLVFLGLVLAAIMLVQSSERLDTWVEGRRQEMDRFLAGSGHATIKKLIESKNPLLTFTYAKVKSIRATTFDGTDRAGNHGSNVSELDLVITYHWQGLNRNDEYGDVEFLVDVPTDKIKKVLYLSTNTGLDLDKVNGFK